MVIHIFTMQIGDSLTISIHCWSKSFLGDIVLITCRNLEYRNPFSFWIVWSQHLELFSCPGFKDEESEEIPLATGSKKEADQNCPQIS